MKMEKEMKREYWHEGYHPARNAVDASIAEKERCPQCGSLCRYEGWERQGSYIALAVCRCGWYVVF